MSTQIVPFDSGKVPSAIATIFGDASANDLVGNAPAGGFPVISIKGKVFHINRGGDRILVTKPGEDDPAASIEVVVLKANPNNSKVFYASGYQEGSEAKPTCYSNNGNSPELDAQEPQAKTCATCVHNQWGSRITEGGKKGKACADSRRIAIATVDTPNDPMLVRVPAASLKGMVEYGKILAARGVRPEACVTRIGFDYTVAYPSLTFKPTGLIGDPDLLQEIKEARDSELVAQIVGMKPTPPADAPAEDGESAAAPAPVVAKATAAPAPKPAAPKPAAAAAPKPAAPKPAAVETPAATPSALEAEIGGLIDGMDFDN